MANKNSEDIKELYKLLATLDTAEDFEFAKVGPRVSLLSDFKWA